MRATASQRERGLVPAALVASAALVPRLWFVLSDHTPGRYVAADMAMYVERADHWRTGTLSVADTLTAPGYPLLLALAHALAPASWPVLVAWVHALLGAATCALVYPVARRLSRSTAVALASSLAVALYVPLVFYEGLLLSETTLAFLVALSVWLLLRAAERTTWPRCAAAGAAVGAAAVVHANFALLLPLLFLFDRRLAWRVAVVALVPIAAASARASLLTGHVTGIATSGGVDFFLAHSDWSGVRFPAGDAIAAIVPRPNAMRGGAPFLATAHAWDERAFYALGWRAIAAHPLRLVSDLRNLRDGLGLGALDYYPGWMAHPRLLRAFSRAFFWVALAPAAAHALVLARARAFARRPARIVCWLVVVQALAALYLYLGDPRIRLPFDVVVLPLAADAWLAFTSAGIARWRRRAKPC